MSSFSGSILGPLFFILYINDISNASNLTESLIFADDTSILLTFWSKLFAVCNDWRITKIWTKVQSNKVSVNVKIYNFQI